MLLHYKNDNLSGVELTPAEIDKILTSAAAVAVKKLTGQDVDLSGGEFYNGGQAVTVAEYTLQVNNTGVQEERTDEHEMPD